MSVSKPKCQEFEPRKLPNIEQRPKMVMKALQLKPTFIAETENAYNASECLQSIKFSLEGMEEDYAKQS